MITALVVLCAVLWILGGYGTINGCVAATRHYPGKGFEVLAMLTWPFVVAWVLFTSERTR